MKPNKKMFAFDGGEECMKKAEELYKDLDFKKRSFNTFLISLEKSVQNIEDISFLTLEYMLELENKREDLIERYGLKTLFDRIQEIENQISDLIILLTGNSKEFLDGISPGRKGIEEVVEIGRYYFFEPKGVN